TLLPSSGRPVTILLPPPPCTTPFPYTTLFRSYNPDVAARRLARPGSAFKPFTLLALLQSGKLSTTESLVCRRTLHVGSHDLSCRSEEHTSELQSRENLVCRLLLEKKNKKRSSL